MHCTTVRYVHEFSYYTAGDLHILRYTHEIWDTEGSGLQITCDTNDRTFLDVGYDLVDEKLWNKMNKQKRKPTLMIRSKAGRINVIGELKGEEMGSIFEYKILNGADVKTLLLEKDVVFEFPNMTFALWRIAKADEIVKFISHCEDTSSFKR